jgi:hypothetical protein
VRLTKGLHLTLLTDSRRGQPLPGVKILTYPVSPGGSFLQIPETTAQIHRLWAVDPMYNYTLSHFSLFSEFSLKSYSSPALIQ